MRISPKVGITLAAIFVGLCAAKYFAEERFPSVVFAPVVLCGIVDGLWEKRIFVGLRQVGITIQRNDSPGLYWLAIFFYLSLASGAIYSLF